MYINWKPAEEGNILYNDKKFLSLLYSRNNDKFTEYYRLSDAKIDALSIAHHFINKANIVEVIVDCENANPFKLSALLESLDNDCRLRIDKIILIDDPNTVNAWSRFSEITNIPVEHKLIERIKYSKSLVDLGLAAQACEGHYKNGVDSFIIVSSDSDYWTLPNSLPNAHFLFLVEYENFGRYYKNALKSARIPYCYIDAFCPDDTDELTKKVLVEELNRELGKHPVNLFDQLERTLSDERISMSESIRKRLHEHIKDVRISIDSDGYMNFNLNV